MAKMLHKRGAVSNQAGNLVTDDARVTEALRRLRDRASSGLATVIDKVVEDEERRDRQNGKKTAGNSKRPAARKPA